MTYETTPPPAAPAGAPRVPAIREQEGRRRGNALGIAALVVAALGAVAAVVPGILILGWILLPIGLVLGIVAVCLRGRSKWAGTTAIVISAVGSIAGVAAFATIATNAVADAIGGTAAVVDEAPSLDPQPADQSEDAAAGGASRENPLPLGLTIADGQWELTVNSVDLDAGDAIAAENPYNAPAPDGHRYILVNVTETYIGDDDGMAALNTVDYVTSDGVTIDSTSAIVVTPDQLDSTSTLYSGGSVTGNIALAVPADTAADGTIAVTLSFFGETTFFAVR